MSESETLIVTLPSEIVSTVRHAVETGDYPSAGEVIRAALRDWQSKRGSQPQIEATLRADIDAGLADVAAGRVADFDAARIVERGRALSADR